MYNDKKSLTYEKIQYDEKIQQDDDFLDAIDDDGIGDDILFF